MSRPNKLTAEQIALIASIVEERRAYDAIPTNGDLARSLGVSDRTIAKVIHRINMDRRAGLARKAREMRRRVREEKRVAISEPGSCRE